MEASLFSLPTLWRRRMGEWSVLMCRGELEIEPERTEDVSGGEAIAACGKEMTGKCAKYEPMSRGNCSTLQKQ